MRSSQIKRKMETLNNQFNAAGIKSFFLISKRGVPYIKIAKKNNLFSVCYFAKSDLFRLFKSVTNKKLCDIKTETELIKYVCD